jgi:hypothetical protein
MSPLTDTSWFWVAVAAATVLALYVIDTVFRVVVDRHAGHWAASGGDVRRPLVLALPPKRDAS